MESVSSSSTSSLLAALRVIIGLPGDASSVLERKTKTKLTTKCGNIKHEKCCIVCHGSHANEGEAGWGFAGLSSSDQLSLRFGGLVTSSTVGELKKSSEVRNMLALSASWRGE